MIEDPAQHLLLLRRGRRVEACVAVTAKGGGLIYFGMVTVDPQLQAQGIGKAVLGGAERFALSELGASRAEMTVIEQRQELIAWYQRRGYQLTGERRPFPDDPRFGLPKRGDLEFVVLEKELRSPSSEA
jgi:ribosomal protein S18 acetylase RimI-like enzyme